MPEPPPDQAEQLRAALNELAASWRKTLGPVLEAVGRQLAAAAQAMCDADLVDEPGRRDRRADRPAWLSPYGPPPRRGRHL